jgi:hypothetical protein
MDEREVRSTLHANILPIFSFIEDGIRFDCRRVFSVDTGWHYYLLWEDGQFDSIVSDEDNRKLESTSANPTEAAPIPHEIGYVALTERFPQWSQDVSEMDFSERKRNNNKGMHYGYAGEWLMWSPIMVVALPFTIPSLIKGNHVYAKIFSLELETTRKSVTKKLGAPTKTLGTQGEYEVLVFTRSTIYSEAETHTVSIGLRNDNVIWIRHFYDASTDTWPREEAPAETL